MYYGEDEAMEYFYEVMEREDEKDRRDNEETKRLENKYSKNKDEQIQYIRKYINKINRKVKDKTTLKKLFYSLSVIYCDEKKLFREDKDGSIKLSYSKKYLDGLPSYTLLRIIDEYDYFLQTLNNK